MKYRKKNAEDLLINLKNRVLVMIHIRVECPNKFHVKNSVKVRCFVIIEFADGPPNLKTKKNQH